MTRCPRCNATTHLEFPEGGARCDGCDRTPAWCRCAPTESKREPVWLQRARTNGFIAKDFTRSQVA